MALPPDEQAWYDHIVQLHYSRPFLAAGLGGIQTWHCGEPPPPERVFFEHPMLDGWKPPRGATGSR